MAKWKCYFGVVSVVVLLLALFLNFDCVGDLLLPNLPDRNINETQWGSRDSQDTRVSDILIKVPDATLKFLNERIRNRNVPPSIPNSNFSLGFNSDYLHVVMDYWVNNYKWRHWEEVINRFPHRFTTIDGLQVHFIHIKPVLKEGQISIPILLLHGWPGSFFEFYKLISLLSANDKDSYAFEIVCPSLVGFGWSDRPQKPGFGMIESADIMFKLMNRLNITKKFYIQGGDFGSLIASAMSIINPSRVAGLHSNMIEVPLNDLRYLIKIYIGSLLPSWAHFIDQDDLDYVYPWSKIVGEKLTQLGYFWLQATRPATIGIVLSDTPTGLAAYILEKFGSWSNNLSYHLSSPHGGIADQKITVDEMLTNVMIYYITNSISSSVMYYKDVLSEENLQMSKLPVTVPTALAAFPNELIIVPKSLASIKYRDIRQYTRMPRGGHFAALEEPELLFKDIRSFVEMMEHF